LFWTWKSRHRTGRPGVPRDVRALIRDMSAANPLWGAHPRPPSLTWHTLLAKHASQIMAADLFVVPTISFRLLFVHHHPRARPSTDRARAQCFFGE
jgi:hypothetical protein